MTCLRNILKRPVQAYCPDDIGIVFSCMSTQIYKGSVQAFVALVLYKIKTSAFPQSCAKRILVYIRTYLGVFA